MVRGATLAAKPINDDEVLSVTWTLPGGFGYVLNELHLNIQQDVQSDWDNRGHWRLSQSSQANLNFDYRIPIDFLSFVGSVGSLTELRATKINGILTRTPIIPRVTGATNSLHFVNLADPAGAAGTVDALISFWEYDLQQLQYFPVHMASGVFNR